jgi:hypothetical protein
VQLAVFFVGFVVAGINAGAVSLAVFLPNSFYAFLVGAVGEGEFIIILAEALRAFETVVEYFLLGANVRGCIFYFAQLMVGLFNFGI